MLTGCYSNGEIYGWIARNLEDYTTCSFERLLAHFVSNVAKDGHGWAREETAPADYLQPYLEEVLPIAEQLRGSMKNLYVIDFLACRIVFC